MRSLIFFFAILSAFNAGAQEYSAQLGLVKYNGGGDWYANLETSLKNLVQFCNSELQTNIDPEQKIVELSNKEIFLLPFLHLTGHGNISLNRTEVENLRTYLIGGGFLHIDDNYGMDVFIRREMKKVFPELDFVELPSNHSVFQKPFSFPNGLPKIHEHDGKEAQAFALFWEGRIVCMYTFESDLGDGWESPEVHNDNEKVRQKALKMGANIIQHAFMPEDGGS